MSAKVLGPAKGIGAVNSSVSLCSSSHDIYTVYSPPHIRKCVIEKALNAPSKVDEELLASLNKHKSFSLICKAFAYICLIAVYPIYLLLYMLPKIMYEKIFYPVLRKIYQTFEPPINRLCRFVKRILALLCKYLLRKKEQIQKIVKKIVDAVKSFLFRIFNPIWLWLVKKITKYSAVTRKIARAAFVPLKSLFVKIAKFIQQRGAKLASQIYKGGSYLGDILSKRLKNITSIFVSVLWHGSVQLNRFFNVLISCLNIVPKFAGLMGHEISVDVKELCKNNLGDWTTRKPRG